MRFLTVLGVVTVATLVLPFVGVCALMILIPSGMSGPEAASYALAAMGVLACMDAIARHKNGLEYPLGVIAGWCVASGIFWTVLR